MNNVAYLQTLPQKSANGVEVVQTPKYKTTDGKLFDTEYEANEHQTLLETACELMNDYKRCVYGTTYRGDGVETVYPRDQSLLMYTVQLLEDLQKQNKYFP